MRKASQWSGVSGQLSVEAFKPGPRRLWLDSRDQVLPQPIQDALYDALSPAADYAEIDISFTASGSYDPGRNWGPPEKCYPEEGGEERELSEIVLRLEDGSEVKPDSKVQEAIFEALLDQVEDVTLDYGDEDCDDRWERD